MKNLRSFFSLLFLSLILSLINKPLTAQAQEKFDLVILNGRVIDPETKLDAIRNIGISGTRISLITSEAIQGKRSINAAGLVVAPGFIDLHIHGRSNQEQEYQLHDGVTTALELEWGVEFMKDWLDSRASKARINYGASVNWPFERFRAMEQFKPALGKLQETVQSGNSGIENLFNTIIPSYTLQPTPAEAAAARQHIIQSLKEGGIGIGVPVGYLPKTKSYEMYEVFKLAGEMNTIIFSHVREPNILSIQEAMANAMITNSRLHLVHINSMSLGNIETSLELIRNAQSKGFDITTELYPYTAASTMLQSALFNEGWQEKLGMNYGDLQWVETGERLTKEKFDQYRKSGGTIIMHMMKPEWIKTGLAAPAVMVASDGMAYAPLAHPRTAGTFSRVLGKYVREEKVIDLNTAIEKMTLLPAKRLEADAPSMRFKGRIQTGMDADITIFNPATIADQATFEKGLAFSSGIEHVIVNGTPVLSNGKSVEKVFPGQPVYGKLKQ
jgi:N-acyl-D-aspartate/D-glutamate deacylase